MPARRFTEINGMVVKRDSVLLVEGPSKGGSGGRPRSVTKFAGFAELSTSPPAEPTPPGAAPIPRPEPGVHAPSTRVAGLELTDGVIRVTQEGLGGAPGMPWSDRTGANAAWRTSTDVPVDDESTVTLERAGARGNAKYELRVGHLEMLELIEAGE